MIRVLSFRCSSCLLKQLRHTSSSPYAANQPISSTLCAGESEKTQTKTVLENENQLSQNKSSLVAAAFEKLKVLSNSVEVNDDVISKMINEAGDKEALLSIVKLKKLTKKHALKMVSVLADWTVEGKVKTTDFEKDPRFITVCKILGSKLIVNPEDTKVKDTKQITDLNTVLGVASDDEAAKLISNISLSQMVKVLSTLASKKRRSTPLLRSLAFNIASSTEKLDIKQGADALYALASLNYHDEMLLDRICADLSNCVMSNSRRAVVGSIITSMGLLRYKHIDLLNMLSEWIEKHLDTCTHHDFMTLVKTLAVVNHLPENHGSLFPMVTKQIEASGTADACHWLDFVWSLVVLQKHSVDQVASVLSQDFIDKLRTVNPDGLTMPVKLKLLNINGVAKLRMKNYKGPLLDLSLEEWKTPVLRSKEKQTLVAAVQETMLNLLPSAVYLATNIETDMGFIIDAECLMNTKLMPLPLFDKKTKAPIDRSGPDMQKGIKVAILVLDYHDMTRGKREPTGTNVLYQELTRLKGYRLLIVDYLDFNPKSNLVARVQYLNQQLKSALGKS